MTAYWMKLLRCETRRVSVSPRDKSTKKSRILSMDLFLCFPLGSLLLVPTSHVDRTGRSLRADFNLECLHHVVVLVKRTDVMKLVVWDRQN